MPRKRTFIQRNCGYCSTELEIPDRGSQFYYCSRDCKSKHFSIRFSGSNNPNYGKTWDKEKRKEQSSKLKEIYEDNPELRFKVGSSNRGHKFSPDRIAKMHAPGRAYGRTSYTPELRKRIGKKSKEKWTEEYKQNHRKKMEASGHWIPLEKKTDWELYSKEANWVESHFEMFIAHPLYEEIGIFHSKKNSKGLVRDHAFSRRSGFEQKVFPEILRHPVNVNVITHSENLRKKKKRYVDNDKISLYELFDMIRNYPGSWKEQSSCLDLIERYLEGQRWAPLRKEVVL